MAPPRQRTTAVQDDSRSEGSSTAKEAKSSGKSRKTATAATGSYAVKPGVNLPSVTSAPADIDHSNQVKINWPDMPLDLLHSYRHSYKLSCPSAFTSEYSHMILSKGIGLRSPTSIAAQRAHLARDDAAGPNGLARPHRHTTHHRHQHQHHASLAKGVGASAPPALDPKSALHRIVGQDRVSKGQLALAVRKHFNSAGLAEQEAIARFLYKVREEGRGRQFRLRFQP